MNLDKTTGTISIIGMGRFGTVLSKILKDDFTLKVFDPNELAQKKAAQLGLNTVSLEEALKANVVIYCVPISKFEEIFLEHKDKIAANGHDITVMDVLSVKTHPKNVLEKNLPKNACALLTHPMFGPDSLADGDLTGKKIVIDSLKMEKDKLSFWLDYFKSKKMEVIEMSADRHDELASSSQGIAHFIGRMLENAKIKPTEIDTLGATRLNELKDVVSNDTWQLFDDLQYYNPYSRKTVSKLTDAQKAIYARAMPNRIYRDRLVVGIQGGKGSFNEEAARYYLSRTPEQDFELVYLYTSSNVLKALEAGDIDRGQFAIHNSVGGLVHESAWAMADYRFNIVEEFGIKISHSIMIAKGANFDEIDTIMAHPQVFRQCKNNLEKKYSKLKLKSGEGAMIDHARVAEMLGKGEMDKNVAVMGSKVLAEIHGLKIVENNLQDLDTNFTQFLWTERLNKLK